LPFPEPGRMTRLEEVPPPPAESSKAASPANYFDWRGQSHSFAALAAYRGGCWEHLSPEQRRARVEAIVQRIEETAGQWRGSHGLRRRRQESRGERLSGPRCRGRACAEALRPGGQAEEISRASLPCVHPPHPPTVATRLPPEVHPQPHHPASGGPRSRARLCRKELQRAIPLSPMTCGIGW
jgi:hypothetical protein